MNAYLRATATFGFLFLVPLVEPTVFACTGITLKPKDGAVIFARTLEFATDLKSNLIVVPRDRECVGSAPGGVPGFRWHSKYAIVGINAFDKPFVVDGLNEQGLSVGLFYFPGFAEYQEIESDEAERTIAPWEVGSYLLSTCSNVKEAVAAADRVLVGPVVLPDLGFVPPVHFVVTDPTGKSVVLEYVGGELQIHTNPFGVMSNAPTFDWHMTNLSNYVTLSAKNVEQFDLAGKEIKALGQGSGMLGLPGDFTPPSRFVRAAAFSKTAISVETARDGVLQAFHILNLFDIPKGAAQSIEQGKEVCDYTLWTSAADLKNRRYYFRTYENSRIRMVDMKALDLEDSEVRTILMSGEEDILELR